MHNSYEFFGTDEEIDQFKDSLGATWPFASDIAGAGDMYNAEYIPEIVLIDRNGEIAFQHTGLVSAQTLAEEIAKIY